MPCYQFQARNLQPAACGRFFVFQIRSYLTESGWVAPAEQQSGHFAHSLANSPPLPYVQSSVQWSLTDYKDIDLDAQSFRQEISRVILARGMPERVTAAMRGDGQHCFSRPVNGRAPVIILKS